MGNAIVGMAESAARLMLSEPEQWTPEDLGRQVGRLAAAAQAAV